MRRKLNTLIFLSPWLVTFIFFWLYPLLYSLYLSFQNYNPLSPDDVKFVGLSNYVKLFSDPLFIKALKNTVVFVVGTIPFTTIIALLLALLLSQKILFKNFFRAGYFLPTIISLVVISLVFKSLYSPHGYLNFFLDVVGLKVKIWSVFGIQQGSWLLSPKCSLVSIMVMDIWAAVGFYMVLFLAALTNISSDYYDAAKIDGASAFQRFWKITLPLLKPMILFVIVINTIFTFQVFTEIYTMTPGGGVFNSTLTVVYYLYEKAFRHFEMGYASAMAYMLFVVIFVVSLVQMRLLKAEN